MPPYFDFLPTSDLGIVVLIIGIITGTLAVCGYLLRDVLFQKTKQQNNK